MPNFLLQMQNQNMKSLLALLLSLYATVLPLLCTDYHEDYHVFTDNVITGKEFSFINLYRFVVSAVNLFGFCLSQITTCVALSP